MELEGYPEEPDGVLGSSRLVMRDRTGKENLQLACSDGSQHGDTQELVLGVDDRSEGAAIVSHSSGSPLSLGGEGGQIEMSFDPTGPYFRMRANPMQVFGTSRPQSLVYLGRQDLEGGTDGSLRATFLHGGGTARLSSDPGGQPSLRMTNAQDGIVAPEQP